MNSFAKAQEAAFHSLVGANISAWHCVEMAVREVGAGEQPQFSDSTVPYLQVFVLDATLATSGFKRVRTYQNYDSWGIRLEHYAEAPTRDFGFGNTFRTRAVHELPTGLINSVDVLKDNKDDIQTVTLYIAEQKVSLIAGEIYEQSDGSLRVQLGGDESVLVLVTEDA